MAKKSKKSTSLFEKVQDVVNEESSVESSPSIPLMDIASEPKSEVQVEQTKEVVLEQDPAAAIFQAQKENNIQLPKTTLSKLEDLEKYEQENAQLFQENSELKEKIAEYLEEIDALKLGTAANENRQEQLENLRAELEKVNEKNKQLQKEADDYLMKISELTFENAKQYA